MTAYIEMDTLTEKSISESSDTNALTYNKASGHLNGRKITVLDVENPSCEEIICVAVLAMITSCLVIMIPGLMGSLFGTAHYVTDHSRDFNRTVIEGGFPIIQTNHSRDIKLYRFTNTGLTVGLSVGINVGIPVVVGVLAACWMLKQKANYRYQTRVNNERNVRIDELINQMPYHGNSSVALSREEFQEILPFCNKTTIFKEMSYKQLKNVYENNPQQFQQYLSDGWLSESQTLEWNKVFQMKDLDTAAVINAFDSKVFTQQIKDDPTILVAILQHMSKGFLDDQGLLKVLTAFVRENLLAKEESSMISDEEILYVMETIADGGSYKLAFVKPSQCVVDFLPVKFKVGDQMIESHKTLLSEASPVFKAMFFGPLAKEDKEIYEIPETDHDYFREIIEFVELGSISINDENLD